jgi:hypothetical protein
VADRDARPRRADVDPLWFKDAVIYELHVRAFFDSDGERHRRLPRPHAEARLPAGPRRHDALAPAVLPLAAEGRRLRHRRLHRRARQLWHPPRRRGAAARGAQAGTPRDHGAGPEPHLRSAPVVPARAACPRGQQPAELLRLERRPHALRGGAHHLQGLRELQLDVGPGRQRLLLAPLLLAPAGPQLREPRGAEGRDGRPGLLGEARCRRLPPGRRPLPLRARGYQLREPPRDARVPEGAPQAHA